MFSFYIWLILVFKDLDKYLFLVIVIYFVRERWIYFKVGYYCFGVMCKISSLNRFFLFFFKLWVIYLEEKVNKAFVKC